MKRQVGLPSYWLTHTELRVSMGDNCYLVKSTLRNLTGKGLTVYAEAVAYDRVGYYTFDSSSFITLLSSGQLMGFSGLARHQDYRKGIVIHPYDEVDLEILSVSKTDGALAMYHTHGYSTLPTSEACTMQVKVAGHGLPHKFLLSVERKHDSSALIVRQSGSSHECGKILDLPLHNERSVPVSKASGSSDDHTHGVPKVPGMLENALLGTMTPTQKGG
jgi:hypothetical protein